MPKCKALGLDWVKIYDGHMHNTEAWLKMYNAQVQSAGTWLSKNA